LAWGRRGIRISRNSKKMKEILVGSNDRDAGGLDTMTTWNISLCQRDVQYTLTNRCTPATTRWCCEANGPRSGRSDDQRASQKRKARSLQTLALALAPTSACHRKLKNPGLPLLASRPDPDRVLVATTDPTWSRSSALSGPPPPTPIFLFHP
jgi:hypothetical protein